MTTKNFGVFDNSIYHDYGADTFIVGVDPGVTTGVSVLGWEGDTPMPDDVPLWGSDQISYGGSGNANDLIDGDGGYPEQHIAHKIAQVVRDLRYHHGGAVHVAIEDFIIRRVDSSRDFLSPVRITAGIMQELYRHLQVDDPFVRLWFQSPSSAKGTCTDDRMDKWGYHIKTKKDRHSRDADRHAVLLLRRMIENPKLRIKQ